jgi:hypothetical protein
MQVLISLPAPVSSIDISTVAEAAKADLLRVKRSRVVEQFCHDITCPALANERVQANAAGQVLLELKTPQRDGTTHLELSPLDFRRRPASAVPQPRLNFRTAASSRRISPVRLRCGSRFYGPLPEFIAAKRPLKLRCQEAATRHRVHPTLKRHSVT